MDEVRTRLRNEVQQALDKQGGIVAGTNNLAQAISNRFRSALQCAISDFQEGFVSNLEQLLGLSAEDLVQPEGCKYLWGNSSILICIVEQKPQTRAVRFKMRKVCMGARTPATKPHRVAFPYVQFIMKFERQSGGRLVLAKSNGGLYDTLKVTYTKKPLKSLSDQLYFPNLPNIGGAGNDDMGLCMGGNFKDGHDSNSPLNEQVEQIINYYWNSTFNDDLRHNFDYIAEKDIRLTTISDWVKASKVDPLFTLKVDWKEYKTAKNIIDGWRREFNVNGEAMVNSAVNSLYRNLWLKVFPQAVPPQTEQTLKNLFRTELQGFLDRFVDNFADGMAVLGNNQAVHSTVKLATVKAVKAALGDN